MRWQLQWAHLQDVLRPLKADGVRWRTDVHRLAGMVGDVYGEGVEPSSS
jgi:hypothetical protein